MSVEREEAYRRLAEDATGAIKKPAEDSREIAAGVDELRKRSAAIEQMLRDVG